jgi:hypothetical protein
VYRDVYRGLFLHDAFAAATSTRTVWDEFRCAVGTLSPSVPVCAQ